MKQAIHALSLVVVTLFSAVGCTSVPPASTGSPWIATTLEITGTEGAPFTGYYLVQGRKVSVSGSIPGPSPLSGFQNANSASAIPKMSCG